VERNSPSNELFTPMKNKSSASTERNILKECMRTISCDAISTTLLPITPFGRVKSINYCSKVPLNSLHFWKQSQGLLSSRMTTKS